MQNAYFSRQNTAHKVQILSVFILFALVLQLLALALKCLAHALESLAEVFEVLFLDRKPEDCKSADSRKQQRADYDTRNLSARKSVLFGRRSDFAARRRIFIYGGKSCFAVYGKV